MQPFQPFERMMDPVAPPGAPAARLLGVPVPEAPPPPSLLGFYWHFARQARVLFVALFAAGLAVALLDLMIPLFIGRVIGLLETAGPEAIWAEAGGTLLVMAAVLMIGRPIAILCQNLVTQQGIIPGVTSMIRWQSHWHVVRQGLPFFQEDFAGRIANRVMQAGPALRESVVQAVNAVWYILVYGTGAMLALASTDVRLAMPMLVWFVLYATLLRLIVPRMRDRARTASEARSLLTGRVVDSYTNIMTVKLFARAEQEDAHVREALERLNRDFGLQTRLGSVINLSLVRELGPVLAATMLAGRVGSAMAAELGTMRVTEQIDALESMGANPIYYLVVPRFLGCLVLIPSLTVMADFMGVLGGYFYSHVLLGIDYHHYWANSREYVDAFDFLLGIFKSLFFGADIALVSCHHGFHCQPGAEGVGRAATNAFVHSFVLILILDLFLGIWLNNVHDFFRPEGPRRLL
jgi:ABC transport permease subunit